MRGSNLKNKVLIADDDLFVRKVIATALSVYADIIEAKDGLEVQELYKQHMPDMVFMDIHLPHISGLELIEALQTIDDKVYIVMMSADGTTENVQYSKTHGTKGFLVKPFERARVLHHFNSCPTIKFSDKSA